MLLFIPFTIAALFLCEFASRCPTCSASVDVAPAGLFSELPRERREDFDNIKLFLYSLPDAFNADIQKDFETNARDAGSDCDFMLRPCTETIWAGRYSMSRQRGQEIIILRKFLASSALTDDPTEADIFVVPALIASDCNLGGFLPHCHQTGNPDAPNLLQHLKYYSPVTRHRHLFLATADIHNLPTFIQAQQLLISKGSSWGDQPGHLVAPPAVTDVELQPASYQEVPLEQRSILFYFAGTPSNKVRTAMLGDLTHGPPSYEKELVGAMRLLGMSNLSKPVVIQISNRGTGWSPNKLTEALKRAVFCPAPPAEASGGFKRLFDILLSGCLPVVVAFETIWGSGISWWRRNGSPVEWSLPFTWEIDWYRLVVQISEEQFLSEGMIPPCASMTRSEIQSKLDYLEEIRGLLLYDLVGGQRDAFSLIMDGIRRAMPKLVIEPSPQFQMPPDLEGSRICVKLGRKLTIIELESDWGLLKDKRWSHSFGFISCFPAKRWSAIPLNWVTASSRETSDACLVTMEQYSATKMVRVSDTRSVSLMSSSRRSCPNLQEQQMIIQAAQFTSCGIERFPQACHDFGDCNDRELGVPTTRCQLTPQFDPLPFRALSVSRINTRWEIVLASCGFTGHADDLQTHMFQDDWHDLVPDHTFHVVAYDSCALGNKSESDDSALLQHIVATMHQWRSGKQIPAAFLFLPSSLMQVSFHSNTSTFDWGRPREILTRLAKRLSGMSPTDMRSDWLVYFGGPPRHLNSAAWAPAWAHEPESQAPAFAFSTNLLRLDMLDDWEILAATCYGHPNDVAYQALDLLSKAVEDQNRIVHEALTSQNVVVLESCLKAYEDGNWFRFSGAAALTMLDRMMEQSLDCMSNAGSYFVYDWNPTESVHESSWSAYCGSFFRTFVSQVLPTDDYWEPLDMIGVCFPASQCKSNDLPALGWHVMLRDLIGFTEEASACWNLSKPEAAKVLAVAHTAAGSADILVDGLRDARDRRLATHAEAKQRDQRQIA